MARMASALRLVAAIHVADPSAAVMRFRFPGLGGTAVDAHKGQLVGADRVRQGHGAPDPGLATLTALWGVLGVVLPAAAHPEPWR